MARNLNQEGARESQYDTLFPTVLIFASIGHKLEREGTLVISENAWLLCNFGK